VRDTVPVFFIIVDEARLNDTRSQIQTVRHHSRAEDAASLIDSVEWLACGITRGRELLTRWTRGLQMKGGSLGRLPSRIGS